MSSVTNDRAKPIIIVEAASQQQSETISEDLVFHMKWVVMSVGALLDMDVKSKRVHIPSGAMEVWMRFLPLLWQDSRDYSDY